MDRTMHITPHIVENIPEHADMETGILYISEKYRTAIHLCCCGCRSEVVTPTDTNGWILMRNSLDEVTLRPSIGNFQIPCKTHYYITNNKVEWL